MRAGFVLPALFRAAAAVLATAAAVVFPGCAKVPESTGDTGVLLRVRLRFRGEIQATSNLRPVTYMVLLHRTDNPNDPGPVPAVLPPWGGNGFATSSQPGTQGFVGFVQYDNSGYGVYSLALGGVLHLPEERVFQYLGTPEFSLAPRPGERDLFFQVDLSRLPNPTARWCFVNVVATDNLPLSPEDQAKLWDALEDGTQASSPQPWVVLDTSLNDRRTNTVSAKEPTWIDVRDRQFGPAIDEPSLDLVDWEFEIQRQ